MQPTPNITNVDHRITSVDKSHIVIPVARRTANNKVCRVAHTLTSSPTKLTTQFSRQQFLRDQTVKRTLFDAPSPSLSPNLSPRLSNWSNWSFNEEDPVEMHEDEDRPAITNYMATLARAIRKQTSKEIKETIADIKVINGDLARILKTICTDEPCFELYKKFLPIASILDIATVEELEQALYSFTKDPIHFFQSALDREDLHALHIGTALSSFTENSLIQTLDQVESAHPFTQKVLSKFNRLLELHYDTHYLTSAELFKICFVAEIHLQTGTKGDLYLSKKFTNLERSLQINLKSREFFILCKKHSYIETIKGGEKKISPVILVPDEKEASTEYVGISNLRGHTITKLEYDLLVYFANRRTVHDVDIGEIRSLYIDQYKNKQSIIQHREECLLSLAPDEKGIKITEKELIELLKDIAEDIFTLHNGEICHHDLKLENILFKKATNTLLHSCITDFGHACAAGAIPRNGTKSYGTQEYTAPEALTNPFELGDSKAKDMYAVGYMIHELLLGQPIWGADMITYFFENSDRLLETILHKQRAALKELTALAQQNPLYALMARLLDPNPKTRMTAKEFALTLKYL
jgi:hypothetical protein